MTKTWDEAYDDVVRLLASRHGDAGSRTTDMANAQLELLRKMAESDLSEYKFREKAEAEADKLLLDAFMAKHPLEPWGVWHYGDDNTSINTDTQAWKQAAISAKYHYWTDRYGSIRTTGGFVSLKEDGTGFPHNTVPSLYTGWKWGDLIACYKRIEPEES